MESLFSDYGLFLLELLTVAVVVVAAVLIVVSAAKKPHEQNRLVVEHINKSLEQRADAARRTILGRRNSRKLIRQRKKEKKRGTETDASAKKRRRVFVLDFKGDIRASATESLREEVSAVLALAEDKDEVLLRLENSGGTVHEHGLAASQLLRLRSRGIHLTVAVDKVAASGGYLMACAADRIIAAPFAIIGSIGVLVQLPNFHRMLEQKGIDFELLTAGRFKRTLTLFGENTDEGREKLRQEIIEVHELFQQRIKELRPAVDLEMVATGEHWYGSHALELNLIDEIGTSDDFMLGAAETADLYRISYRRQRKLIDRMLQGAEGVLYR
ncbi:MAG TPA: protease SohB [Gammaproteobacteria bacterium]|nr:protease SohB [Gammaproteobacteria bacterium]